MQDEKGKLRKIGQENNEKKKKTKGMPEDGGEIKNDGVDVKKAGIMHWRSSGKQGRQQEERNER